MFHPLTQYGLLLYLLFDVAASQICDRTSCEEGHYCSGKECIPCPPGHYQNDGMHTFTSCMVWTSKPPYSHYVRTKNGTSTSDAEWRCEDGYQEKEYTKNRFECSEIPPQVSSTKMAEATTTIGITSPEVVITTENFMLVKGTTGSDSSDLIVGLSLGIGLPACVILVLLICYFTKWRRNRGHLPRDATEQSLLSDSSTTDVEGNYYRFFESIVGRLEDSLAEKFIKILPDSSGKFNSYQIIAFESDKTRDSKIYFTKSLVRWATFNNGIRRSVIQESLALIGRPTLLGDIKIEGNIFIDEVITQVVGGFEVRYMKPLGSENGNKSLVAERKINFPKMSRLAYYLAAKLGDDVMTFVKRLPVVGVDEFNAWNYFQKCLRMKNIDNSFAETFHEFWQRYFINSLDIIDKLLKELHRNDIWQDDSFENLCKGIFSTSNISSTVSIDDEVVSASNLFPIVSIDDEVVSASNLFPTVSIDDEVVSASNLIPTVSIDDEVVSASNISPTVSIDDEVVSASSLCPTVSIDHVADHTFITSA